MRVPRHITACLAAGACLLAAACGDKHPEGSLVIPRGATITVRINEDLHPTTHPEGAEFRAELDTPLSIGADVYVAADAPVVGSVSEVAGEGEMPSMSIELRRLEVPGGQTFTVETSSMTRSPGSPGVSVSEISATTGLEDKIRYLAEVGAQAAAEPPPDASPAAIIPRGTRMVFTLESDLAIPRME
jgi:hypothetical protein